MYNRNYLQENLDITTNQQIYLAAKELKEEALKIILNQDQNCVDEFHGILFPTAAARLTKEKNYEAVRLLIKHGANLHYILEAANMTGDYEYAKQLCEEFHINSDYMIPLFVKGAAFRGDMDFINEVKNKDLYVDLIATYLVAGGHIEKAATFCKDHVVSSASLAEGEILAGKIEQAELFRTKAKIDGDRLAFIAAACGYRDYADFLIKNEISNPNAAAQGAALGGDTDYVRDLLQKTKTEWRFVFNKKTNESVTQEVEVPVIDKQKVLEFAARGGHQYFAGLIAEINNVKDWLFIKLGAAFSGHTRFVEQVKLKDLFSHDIALQAAKGNQVYYLEQQLKNNKASAPVISALTEAGNYTYAAALAKKSHAKKEDLLLGAIAARNFYYLSDAYHDNKKCISFIAKKMIETYQLEKLTVEKTLGGERFFSLIPNADFRKALLMELKNQGKDLSGIYNNEMTHFKNLKTYPVPQDNSFAFIKAFKRMLNINNAPANKPTAPRPR